MARDIVASDTNAPMWDPADPAGSLRTLRDYAERQAGSAIGWYFHGKKSKQKLSRYCRFFAIILTALGGLIPILAAILYSEGTETARSLERLQFQQWGYLSIGLAGLFMGYDRFFGGSSGWMRYIITAMALETLIEEFRVDWLKLEADLGDPPDTVKTLAALDRVKTFLLAIRGQVERETKAWVDEFRSSLTQLEKQTQDALDAAREQSKKDLEAQEAARKSGAEAERAGAIDVTVTAPALKGGYGVELDGKVWRSGLTGPTCGIANVPPGYHEVLVAGVAASDGTTRQASKVVKVSGGAPVVVEIDLG
jgi:hypothetical protein